MGVETTWSYFWHALATTLDLDHVAQFKVRQISMLMEFIYIKIYSNRITARNLTRGESFEAIPDVPYFHVRMLIGHISKAEAVAKKALDSIKPTNPLKSIGVLIHPIHEFEGGITEAEERLFRQIGFDLRAHKVAIWVGHELGDDSAIQKAWILDVGPCPARG